MASDKILALFKRIKKSDDGAEFIEYLNDLDKSTWIAFKASKGADANEFYKGYSNAIDNLIKVFAQCDKER